MVNLKIACPQGLQSQFVQIHKPFKESALFLAKIKKKFKSWEGINGKEILLGRLSVQKEPQSLGDCRQGDGDLSLTWQRT